MPPPTSAPRSAPTADDRGSRAGARIRVGTSGWQYPHWRGAFYPKSLPREQWLEWYARTFDCVEVNASFYRLPETRHLEAWRDAVPAHFRFALKAPRSITHFKKLKNCEQALGDFLGRVEVLGERLGPILFQLPPRWRYNPARLEAFLAALPHAPDCAFEFRDPSWHCDEVAAALREHGAGLCIYDLEGVTSPDEATSRLVYVRLHGPRSAYSGSYRAHALRGWAGRALGWRRDGRAAYLFFDNDERAFAARNARRMLGFLEDEGAQARREVVGTG